MKKWLLITALITLAACSTPFFLFPQLETLDEKVSLTISFAIVVPQLAAVWGFLTSLGAFKRELKRAYYILAAGILLLALTQLQLPIVSFVDIDRVALSWFITFSTLAGALLAYLSMHKFVKILQFRSPPWSSFLFVTAFALALSTLSALVPHVDVGDISEWTIDGIFGSYVASAGYAIGAAYLAWRIRARLGAKYKIAMGALALGMVMLAVSSLHETIIRLFPIFYAESFSWYSLYTVSLWPLFVSTLFLTASSLSFKKLSREFAGIPENATYVDVINYVAQLVSDPKQVDVMLDKLREITATTGSSSELSETQKATLIEVYLQLEAYLVSKEPLLKLTKEGLRARLPETFQQRLPK